MSINKEICPYCNKEINVGYGEQKCPKCRKLINVFPDDGLILRRLIYVCIGEFFKAIFKR